jgi:hypothetical protein
MTFSLPESIDDLYRFTPSDFDIRSVFSQHTHNTVAPNTLWSKLNDCERCVFFRNMAAKSLVAIDFNDANAAVKTLFVPRDNEIDRGDIIPSYYMSSLTIPGQLFIMPESSPANIKVQNKQKEYISINIRDIKDGGDAFVQALDRMWRVVVPNIMCSNGIIHLIEEVYTWN